MVTSTGTSKGQTTVEYGLLIATVAVLAFLSGTFFGKQLYDWLTALAERITWLP